VKKFVLLAAMLSMVLMVGVVPALAQVPVSMVDCMMGGPCIGTSGNDTINASDKQDVIYGLEGDDIIDPGNDSVTDYVFCGPGFDTVNQMPWVLDDMQGDIQYGATEPDVIADDCEVRAL
jgi:hypothetical protein